MRATASDGIVEVVFHYGAPFVTRFGNGREEIEPRIFAISQTSRFIDIRPTGRVGLVSARFFPWGAYHFFRIPVSEFADRQISAEFLWGSAVRELEDRIQSAVNLEARFRLIERFLLGQLRRHHQNDGPPEVSRLIRHVWERSGRIEIPAMAREFTEEDVSVSSAPRCAGVSGFSLHANVRIPSHARRQLEDLGRYVARPAIATQRLRPDSRLLYALRHRWRDGTTHVMFEPLELVAKLAAFGSSSQVQPR